ncbi:MAG: LysR family transcriptional regulator [Phycisphaerales bacterium]|nr:LysR family transcriptional regulator [Phycisphaerales bacterium]
MELTTLRYFLAIADSGHLTRAAEALGVTQPALSAMVKKLEAEVGSPLLHRTGRGVQLTEAGRAFVLEARRAVTHAEGAVRVVREIAGLERGSIRIGGGATAITSILPPVVRRMRREHPGVRFYLREAGSSAVASALLADELDLGVVTLPITIPEAERIVRIPLVEDELRLIAPRGMGDAPARGAPPGAFSWRALAGLSVVGFEAGSAVRSVIDRAASGEGVALDYVMELRSIEGIKGMVEAGVGVGFVSRFALREGEGLTCPRGQLTRRLAIIRRRDREPGPAAAAFERMLLRETGGPPKRES